MNLSKFTLNFGRVFAGISTFVQRGCYHPCPSSLGDDNILCPPGPPTWREISVGSGDPTGTSDIY